MVKNLAATGPDADGSPDLDRLQRARRQRLWAAMDDAGLDGLVLGRPAHVAYASGARQLWTAGSRPFSPACLLVGPTRGVHLLSTWDEGVPADLDRQGLFGLSWNPAVLQSRLAAIPGLGKLRRVGTDGWTPGTERWFRSLMPEAEAVDGRPALRAARTVKDPDEQACLRQAAAAAQAGVAAMVAALQPGISERALLARHAEAVAAMGLPILPTEALAASARPVPPGSAWPPGAGGNGLRPRATTERPLEAGEPVVLSGAACFAGYQVSLTRTWLVPGGDAVGVELAEWARRGRDALIDAGRPGRTGADLQASLARVLTGAPQLRVGDLPLAWGTGLGMEEPLIGPPGSPLGVGAVLAEDMVLTVECRLGDAEGGLAVESDAVVVAGGGAVPLTRFPGCPALGGAPHEGR